jgi:protocatechuate 3,4-dioxygenase beta subunit
MRTIPWPQHTQPESQRRMLLGLIGAGTATTLLAPHWARAADEAATCIVRPRQTEGPYFVDTKLDRSDIRSDPATGAVKEGVPLRVTFQVSQLRERACVPLAGAIVDLWHCDALGVYSDFQDYGAGQFDARGQRFLRGYQATNNAGVARFVTIYPGWYSGRAVHVHFKVRTSPAAQAREFTSQLYFDDALTDQVHTRAPYATRGKRNVSNARDGLYRRGGQELMLALKPDGDGYAGTFALALE